MSNIAQIAQNEHQDHIWDQLIEFSSLHSVNWQELYQYYDLKKLQLEKFCAQQIVGCKKELKKKYEGICQKQKQKSMERMTSQFWMENEYRVFIWFVLTYSKIINLLPEFYGPPEWNLVAQIFHKSVLYCQYFYLACKKMKVDKWTKEEDEYIQKVMRTNASSRWTVIGVHLFSHSQGKFFRKPKSIRERWLSHLNPLIKKAEWTHSEDQRLLQLVELNGKKWSKISTFLGNRSQHSVNNRFKQLETIFPRLKTISVLEMKKQKEQTAEENQKVLKQNRNFLPQQTQIENVFALKTESLENGSMINFMVQ